MPGNSFKFSIGKKILLGFFILILIYIGAMLYGYFQMQHMRVHSQQVIPLSSKINDLQEIGISLESLESTVDKFFTVAYSEHLEKANKDIDDLHRIIWSLENQTDNNTRVRFEELEGTFCEINESLNYLANLRQNSTNHNEINEKRVLVYELIKKSKQKHRELLSEITDQVNANVLEQERIIISLNNQLLNLGIAILAAGTVMSLIISRSISRPVEKLRAATSEIARGNLNVKTGIRSNDEIGELATAFDKMTEELQRTTISRQTLQTMLDSMPYGIVLTSMDKKILHANHPALGMMGYESEEHISGLICNKIFCPAEDGKCPIIDLKQKVDKSEKILINKDGRRIPILKSVVSVNLGDREVLLEAFVDISERKRAEEILRESEARYLRLFEDSPISLWEEDFSEAKKYIDNLRQTGVKNIRSYFETHPEDVGHCAAMVKIVDINKATLDLYEAASKEDFRDGLVKIFSKDSFDVFREELIAFTESKTVFESETVTNTLKGGSNHIFMKLAVVPGYEKTLSKVFVSIIDITERKRAEETLKKLSSAVEESADSVIITNKDAIIEYVNPAFEKLSGFSREEIIGKTPNFLISDKHNKKFYKELNETINSGRVFRAEIINRKKNGEMYYVLTTIAPVTDSKGNITHFVTTEKDITEIKKAEETRIENQQLAYASRAKSEFLANMSHELRTPLNSIIGFTELMKMSTKLDEKNEHYLDNVLTSGKFLLKLINDILDLSKVEAGKIELVIEKLNVSSIIDETLNTIKEKANAHNVILEMKLDPELRFIEADQQRLKQILFNLLSNAVKFSKQEGGTVTITVKKVGDMVEFSVSDTGIGIREEDMAKMFRAFEQLDSGITKKYGGTGLGLAISKKLVELHGGTLTVESRYGEGSTFTFYLPVAAKKGAEMK